MADRAMLERILLIDDSEGDALYVQQRLREAGLDDPVYCLHDAELALAYLAGSGEYSDRTKFPLPDIILLDLSMPKIDGYDMLRWIRSQPGLNRIVIVVLTGECRTGMLDLAYQLGATTFLAKGANTEEFRNFVEFCRTLSRVTMRTSEVAKENRNQAGGESRAA